MSPVSWFALAFKGPEIQSKLSELKAAQQPFEDTFQYLINRKAIETHERVESIDSQLQFVRRTSVVTGSEVREMRQELRSLSGSVATEANINGMHERMNTIEQQLEIFNSMSQSFISMVSNIPLAIQLQARLENTRRHSVGSSGSRTSRRLSGQGLPDIELPMSPQEFTDLIRVPLQLAVDELLQVSKTSQDYSSLTLGQANSIVGKEPFAFWIGQSSPAFLLVDANLDREGGNANKLSAMSLFCAHLGRSIMETDAGALLVFFCAKHHRRSDPLNGPVGLMRSLVAQLFVYLYNKDILDLEALAEAGLSRQALAQGNIRALANVFRLLLDQVPRGTPVFCLVDGVSWFEDSYRQSLEEAIESLYKIFDDDSVEAVFKVMLTSPKALRLNLRCLDYQTQHVRLSRNDAGLRQDTGQIVREVGNAALTRRHTRVGSKSGGDMVRTGTNSTVDSGFCDFED